MKIFPTIRIALLVVSGLVAVIFFSCKKRSSDVVLSPDEYINYTINGTAYNYTMPVDSVMADDSLETSPPFPPGEVRGQRIPNAPNDFARISYDKTGIAMGSLQKLSIFYTLQTGAYIDNVTGYLTSSNPVMINITEYGSVGQFIAGNFTALFTGPPGNTTYNVICDFRVKRKL